MSLPEPDSASRSPASTGMPGMPVRQFPEESGVPSPWRHAITAAMRISEVEAVAALLHRHRTQAQRGEECAATARLAAALVTGARAQRRSASGVDALLHEFSLSSQEGIALMCLAEALLRIPDTATADQLIAEKIGGGNWQRHLGGSPSLFVNAATWGLLITGKMVAARQHSASGLETALTQLIAKGGAPLIRRGVDFAMRLLGDRFVAGRTIDEALRDARGREARGYRHSYDMLGEAALTADDAARYGAAYEAAIHAIGRDAAGQDIHDVSGISVKLSALHPRYAAAQRSRVMTELLPVLRRLALLAREAGIGFTIDAEEADRLELSLDLTEALATDPAMADFDGIGIVVQAYQKRAPAVIDWAIDLARRCNRRLMVRLVKGAYWDAEIKRAQVDGMPDYPVFTRKAHTDASYLVCARKLLAAGDAIYPQFATHNAQTVAAVATLARQTGKSGLRDFEFQCLYGMGETLYDPLVAAGLNPEMAGPLAAMAPVRCRIYAPVGAHDTLLAYLVRRLLENGANSSFVNRLVDDAVPIAELIADPFDIAEETGGTPHPAIPLPRDLYGDVRRNAAGIDLDDRAVWRALVPTLRAASAAPVDAGPLIVAEPVPDVPAAVRNPALRDDVVGMIANASEHDINAALAVAAVDAPAWAAMPPAERAALLRRGADAIETDMAALLALIVREAGRTLPNAVAEVREAVDFLRYYASRIALHDGRPLGPVACISPWNFPLAIFIGQLAAALAAGNVVLAKPAEQTPLTAHHATRLLHAAGIPAAALQLLPGDGAVGARLVADPRVRGVLFTGSTDVALRIHRTLQERMEKAGDGIEIPLVAETGGQNAMIVDASALPEQVVQDALVSAFDSAGQRCSALRVLCLQEEIADRVLTMLHGALRERCVGLPDRLSTDIGPLIDDEARDRVQAHIERMTRQGKPVSQMPLPAACDRGSFVAPAIIEIDAFAELTEEVFGPVLHVLRYSREALPQLVDAINASGYGLTLGVHSRLDATVDAVVARAHVGNIYVNRNIVGAVVGVQPFGGENRSGTGPKAGGPLTLQRLQHAGTHQDLPLLDEQVVARRLEDATQRHWREWLVATGRDDLAASFISMREQAGITLLLPGPTGERNTLSFASRGWVVCAASDNVMLLRQVNMALATGNVPMCFGPAAGIIRAALPAAMRACLQIIDDGALNITPVSCVLTDTGMAGALRKQMAARKDVIVPVIVITGETGDILAARRLLTERTLTINTAAVGGNTSLISL